LVQLGHEHLERRLVLVIVAGLWLLAGDEQEVVVIAGENGSQDGSGSVEVLLEEADFVVEAAVREELLVWKVEVSSGEEKELDLGVAVRCHLVELLEAVEKGGSSTCLQNNLEWINEKARLRENVTVQVLVGSGADDGTLDFVEHVLPIFLVLVA